MFLPYSEFVKKKCKIIFSNITEILDLNEIETYKFMHHQFYLEANLVNNMT